MLDHALKHDVRVVNISQEFTRETASCEDVFGFLFDQLPDVLFVIASGNDSAHNPQDSCPSSLALHRDNVLTVAGSAGDDLAYSNYGLQTAKVAAPLIVEKSQGTSVSAAWVSNLALRILTGHPELKAAELTKLLMSACDAKFLADVLCGGGDYAGVACGVDVMKRLAQACLFFGFIAAVYFVALEPKSVASQFATVIRGHPRLGRAFPMPRPGQELERAATVLPRVQLPSWEALEVGQKTSYRWRREKVSVFFCQDDILHQFVFLEPNLVADLSQYLASDAPVESALADGEPHAYDDELRNRMATIDVLIGLALNATWPGVAAQAHKVIEEHASAELTRASIDSRLRRMRIAEKADFMFALARLDPDAAIASLARESNPRIQQLLEAAMLDGLAYAEKYDAS